MEKKDIYEHWYEVLLEFSENYSILGNVLAMLMGAYPLEHTGIPVSEILKVEDELIQRNIISRKVEYDDGITGYLNEGNDVVRDIKKMIWRNLYDERREREY